MTKTHRRCHRGRGISCLFIEFGKKRFMQIINCCTHLKQLLMVELVNRGFPPTRLTLFPRPHLLHHCLPFLFLIQLAKQLIMSLIEFINSHLAVNLNQWMSVVICWLVQPHETVCSSFNGGVAE